MSENLRLSRSCELPYSYEAEKPLPGMTTGEKALRSGAKSEDLPFKEDALRPRCKDARATKQHIDDNAPEMQALGVAVRQKVSKPMHVA